MSMNKENQSNPEENKSLISQGKYPERAMNQTPPESMKCVYAGPPRPFIPQVTTPMMMVYAGPDAFANASRKGVYGKICSVCRGVASKDAKFCPDCGAKFGSEDESV